MDTELDIIFQNLIVDILMPLNCDQDGTRSCPKNAIFSCVIGVYFLPSFLNSLYIRESLYQEKEFNKEERKVFSPKWI